jgi:mannose-6-phosphate isomerase
MFDPHSAEEWRLQMLGYEGSTTGKTKYYQPPMSEFNMLITQMNANEKERLKAVQGPRS